MGLFDRFRDATRRQQARKVTQELANRLFVNPLCSDYENVFAQVQPLANEMKLIRPFGVGRNGGRLPDGRTPELNLLDSPNEDMGWDEFAGLMFATWLTEDELDIHTHLDNRGRVIGYTVLPPDARQYLGNGRWQWQCSTADGSDTLDRTEVMRLRYSRSPKNPAKGISPATAIRAWAQTEDVLAQYQRAFIENGAVPASVTFIKASTAERFEATRAELENNLRGARNKNKTIYVWRQFNPDTAESQDQIEVKTIQGNNSTLALKDLSDIINDHLNKAFGVSNFILGDDASAKYDNAELSDYQFTRRRVYPALVSFWGQFQHELDRITGGLGYSIQFEIELPVLTERQLVKAQIAEKDTANLINLITAGADADSAVDALDLGDKWRAVARGIRVRVLAGRETQNINDDNGTKANVLQSKNKTAANKLLGSAGTACACLDALPEMTPAELAVYNELVDYAKTLFDGEDADIEKIEAKIEQILEEEAKKGGEGEGEKLADLTSEELSAKIKAELDEWAVAETVREDISERTDELVENYGEATRGIMEETLKNNEGATAGEIRKALREVMPTWQAERIARNEVTYAFQAGRLESDKRLGEKYGLKISKIWRCSNDAKSCPVCRAMDGKVATVDEAFADSVNVDGEQLAWEQSRWNDNGKICCAHTNCRCYYDTKVEEA